MKIAAGIIAASALAGAVAVTTGMSGGILPAVTDGKPAPVNPHKGMQTREEVYEFTTKPAVKKEGGEWVITFASKGKCDATVAILGPDGKIVRHLASGVLGSNAPYPFQQNSLSQKLEWDGLADNFKKAPAGCKVKVSLGLKAEFEKNIVWDPYAMPVRVAPTGAKRGTPGYLLATGKDGVRYVGASDGYWCWGRTYDKEGKYLYTFFPPGAAKLEEVMKPRAHKFATTVWGDKVLIVPPANGFTTGLATAFRSDKGKGRFHKDGRFLNLVTAMKAQPGAGEIKAVPAASAGLAAFKAYPKSTSKRDPMGTSASSFFGISLRMVVDRVREELYLPGPSAGLNRIDGRTGKRDTSWFGGSLGAKWGGRRVGEVAVGSDGLIYVRTGHFLRGNWLWRLTRDGKPVPFKHNAEDMGKSAPIKGITAIWTGQAENQANFHEKGLDVSPNGDIVAAINCSPSAKNPKSREWMQKNGIVTADGKLPGKGGRLLVVWDKDGKVLTPNAVHRSSPYGQGVHMDRDGNIYRHETAVPPGCGGRPAGLAKDAPAMRSCSSLVKYRGRGGAYPIGTGPDRPQKKNRYNSNPWILPAPKGLTDFIELGRLNGTKFTGTKLLGALWAYPGLWTEPGCTCTHVRHDLDDWARTWVPSPHLYSVVVLDSNGNRIARIGRYGNVDDADEKCGKIHMSWPRATAASDEALYIMDHGDLRIIRCKLGYHAEEELPLP